MVQESFWNIGEVGLHSPDLFQTFESMALLSGLGPTEEHTTMGLVSALKASLCLLINF